GREGLALAAQRVELARDEERGWHARHVRREERRGARVLALLRAAEVLGAEELHGLAGQAVPRLAAQPRLVVVVAEVGDGVDEYRPRQRRLGAAQLQGRDRGEVAAGAVAHHVDAGRVGPEPAGVLQGPAGGVDGVVDGRGEAVL